MKHSYLLKNAIGFLNINKLIKVFNVLLFICFSIGLKAQTTSTFASLGANNSGGTGYKTISTNSNLVVENIMENDMTDMYYAGAFNENYTAGPFSIKAYGVTDFTFNGMSFRGYTGLIVDAAHSKVVFKDAGGNTIQTMNLNANKVLGTSSTNLVSFFDNGTTVPIYNVAEIIVEIYQNSDQAYQQNSLNFNYVDITITPSPVNTAPTVTSQALTDVATTTATGNGTISATGGANITERGIYWNLTDGFADGAGTKVSTTGDWSATGAFTQAITGLTPNTTYYVKSFAANSAGTGYGGIESFTTTSVAVLLSSSPTISFSNDTGFSDNIAQDGEGGSTAISDLNLQVMPINSSGVKLSADPLQYHDGSDPLWTGYPAIITYGDTNPLYGWSIKSDDGAEFKLLAVDFLDWGTFSGNTFVIEAFRNGSSLGTATFTGNVTGSFIELRSAGVLTTIFENVDEVRLFEQGGADSYISLNNIQVTTPIAATLASVTTTSVSNYDANSATLGGNVTADGGAAVTERGIVYSTTDATPTIGESGVTQDINGAGTGLFSKSTSGLDASTTYYVQAYAINTAGTSYGGVESFTTDIGELIWNGSESTDWETAENWTPATIPNAGYNVTIPTGASNYPTLSSAGACNNLIIESNASSNGSLIGQSYLTVNGSVTVQRYLTGIDKWHLISSSVEGQSIYNFVVNDVATNAVAAIAPKYGLAPYENSTPGWNHFTTAAGTNDIASAGNFIAGKGYEVLRTTDGTINFTGTLSISDVDIAISKNTNGWNIVGNPYPSAINAANISTNFLSENAAALDGNYEAIYIWDAANSNYITVNNTSGATYVAPGQAFFVYSVDGGSTISFIEAMQTHQSGDIFKSGDIPSPSIKLIAERSQGASATNILYLENTTTGLDPGYDAGRFSASNNNFAVYTRLVGDETNVVDFDIQCLPVDGFEHIIPVGLNAPANTELVFRAETMNLPVGVSVYLEDKLTGGFTALHNPDNFYSIYADKKTEGTGRFFLHTKSTSTLVDPIPGISGFNVIPLPQNNCLRVIGSFGNNAEITVYDMAGRKLLKSKLNNTEHNEVDMGQLISGFYLVSVSSSAQRVSKKISWVKE